MRWMRRIRTNYNAFIKMKDFIAKILRTPIPERKNPENVNRKNSEEFLVSKSVFSRFWPDIEWKTTIHNLTFQCKCLFFRHFKIIWSLYYKLTNFERLKWTVNAVTFSFNFYDQRMPHMSSIKQKRATESHFFFQNSQALFIQRWLVTRVT